MYSRAACRAPILLPCICIEMTHDRSHRGKTWARRAPGDHRAARSLERTLTRAEHLLDRGERDEASRVLAELPPFPYPSSSFHVRAGDCFSSIERFEDAERHFRQALELEPGNSDALHGLGAIHEERGEHEEMVEAWLAVRVLDLREPPPPWSMTADEFTAVAEAALLDVPEAARKHLSNLPILVADSPSEALVEEGIDPRILGLITGTAYPDKLLDGSPSLDCVELYKRNLERIAMDRQQLEEEIRLTVLHETAHYFGLDDDELEAIGLG